MAIFAINFENTFIPMELRAALAHERNKEDREAQFRVIRNAGIRNVEKWRGAFQTLIAKGHTVAIVSTIADRNVVSDCLEKIIGLSESEVSQIERYGYIDSYTFKQNPKIPDKMILIDNKDMKIAIDLKNETEGCICVVVDPLDFDQKHLDKIIELSETYKILPIIPVKVSLPVSKKITSPGSVSLPNGVVVESKSVDDYAETKSDLNALNEAIDKEFNDVGMSAALYNAGKNVVKECRAELDELIKNPEKDTKKNTALMMSLGLAINVIRTPLDSNYISDLEKYANRSKDVSGKPSLGKKLIGALIALAGVAIIGLALAGIPFTGGASLIGMYVGGSLLAAGGAGLFAHGTQRKVAKSLDNLAYEALRNFTDETEKSNNINRELSGVWF